MVESITLKEVLSHIRQGLFFDIEICDASGERVHYKDAVATKEQTGTAAPESVTPESSAAGKNPMHSAHGTINIRTKGIAHPVKIYPVLIEKFNGKLMMI